METELNSNLAAIIINLEYLSNLSSAWVIDHKNITKKSQDFEEDLHRMAKWLDEIYAHFQILSEFYT